MILKVKVTANAKYDSIEKTQKNWNITVRTKAENNMANKRVCELLAIHFNTPLNKVKITRGHKMSSKTIEIID